jgi:hypothetical protein
MTGGHLHKHGSRPWSSCCVTGLLILGAAARVYGVGRWRHAHWRATAALGCHARCWTACMHTLRVQCCRMQLSLSHPHRRNRRPDERDSDRRRRDTCQRDDRLQRPRRAHAVPPGERLGGAGGGWFRPLYQPPRSARPPRDCAAAAAPASAAPALRSARGQTGEEHASPEPAPGPALPAGLTQTSPDCCIYTPMVQTARRRWPSSRPSSAATRAPRSATTWPSRATWSPASRPSTRWAPRGGGGRGRILSTLTGVPPCLRPRQQRPRAAGPSTSTTQNPSLTPAPAPHHPETQTGDARPAQVRWPLRRRGPPERDLHPGRLQLHARARQGVDVRRAGGGGAHHPQDAVSLPAALC